MELINHKRWLSKPRIIAGVMTGTSLDGVDVAIVRFSQSENGRYNLELLAFRTNEFPKETKDLILRIINNNLINKNIIDNNLINNNFILSEISAANFALSHIYNDSIRSLCSDSNIGLHEIDAIGIHGQTVWHQPDKRIIDNYNIASTFQLGSISALSKLAGIPVVGDFRAADIALGGQGAPLVPVFDYEFLSNQEENVIALNIGGIANISFLPAGGGESEVAAFDTGPGNILIDLAMQYYFDKPYDENGETAKAGNINIDLLELLKQNEFINQKPPKSTGREMFNSEYLKSLMKEVATRKPKADGSEVGSEVNNIITTLSYFTANSIAENIIKYADSNAKIIISGGGAKNAYIMNQLRSLLTNAKIFTSENYGIPSDAKEAIAFAYLAYRSIGGLHGNLPSVTGASASTILGMISL